MKLLIAIGQEPMHAMLKRLPNVTVCGEVFDRKSLVPNALALQPDVVIVAERLKGKDFAPVYRLIEDLRLQAPKIRVVYLAGELNIENEEHKSRIKRLAALGVYDIHTMNEVSTGVLTRYVYSAGSRNQLEEWLEEPEPVKKVRRPREAFNGGPVEYYDGPAQPMNGSSGGSTGYGGGEVEYQNIYQHQEINIDNVTIESQEPVQLDAPVLHVPVFEAELPTRPDEEEPTFSGVSETLIENLPPEPTVYDNYQSPVAPEHYERTETPKLLNKKTLLEGGEDDEEYTIQNVYIVSSIKPGTGKSFLSVNLASAIAKYGRDTPDGRRPSVAIIEGDLQNLSIGTLLSINDDEYNLKTAMEQIDLLLDPNGGLRRGVTEKDIDIVNRYVNGCFKPYYNIPNLKTLVGSQFQPDELGLVTGDHYSYLIESIADHFDVVIVDTNSNLNHVSTIPVLRLANQCYYVLNLDFNNVHNNHRYRKKLVKLGIGHKIKYILNEDVSLNKDNKEELRFGPAELLESGYRIEGSIPAIDKSVFLNRIHDGLPIVLDDTKETLRARLGICQVADSIWEMDNLVALTAEHEKYEASQRPKRKKFLGLF